MEKTEQRWPAAVKFIEENRLNDFIGGRFDEIGIIVAGGLYNTLNRAMEHVGCSDTFGNTSIPMYVMNVAYPVVDAEIIQFCQTKKAVLMVEEGQPDYLEQNINTILRRNDVQTRIHGKDVFSMAGEYTCQLMKRDCGNFSRAGNRPLPLFRLWKSTMVKVGKNWRNWCHSGHQVCVPVVRNARSSPPSSCWKRNSANCR